MQILDNEGHPDGKLKNTEQRLIYDLKSTLNPETCRGIRHRLYVSSVLTCCWMMFCSRNHCFGTMLLKNLWLTVSSLVGKVLESLKQVRLPYKTTVTMFVSKYQIKEWNTMNVTTGCENGM
jgi:hypothetical protein